MSSRKWTTLSRGHPAGEIDPGHRHFAGEPDVLTLVGRDRRVDLRAAPVALPLQHPDREIARILDARAAGRLEAVVAAEQRAVVGVVQIDRVRIRHVEAQRAERIPGPGVLPDGEVRRAVGLPVHRGRIDLAAGAVEHAHVHAGDVAGVTAHLRPDVLLHDRERHRPGRIEVDGSELGRERRRRPVGLADDGGVAPHHAAVLDRLGDRSGDVHDHVALAEGEIHVGEPVERGRELAQAPRHRDVKRRKRALPDGAGLFEAVARLEAPDRGGEIGVEHVAAGVLGRAGRR